MTRPLLAVDAPSLYFRAFHGIPEKAARTEAGEPVNAIRGFLDMIAQLVRTRRPDRLVCALVLGNEKVGDAAAADVPRTRRRVLAESRRGRRRPPHH